MLSSHKMFSLFRSMFLKLETNWFKDIIEKYPHVIMTYVRGSDAYYFTKTIIISVVK